MAQKRKLYCLEYRINTAPTGYVITNQNDYSLSAK